ncbi:MAG: 50S ribosomal protein L29 [bacterium]
MKDIKTKNENDLIKELGDKREALRVIRFGIAHSKSRNVKETKGLKKETARILTELNSRVR